MSAIQNAVPIQVVEKWKTINNSYLDYVLAKRYGLSKSQVNQFKNAYNVYAIEEYKINNQKKLSDSEKTEKLKKADDEFCEKVRPLFKNSLYKKWKGKRMHDFKQRMEKKNRKNI